MIEAPVSSVELQTLLGSEQEERATRRQRVHRFLKKIGKQGQRQLSFADLTEDQRVALIRMRAAQIAPAVKAAPTPAPKAVAALSDAEIAALSEKWEAASDKRRARAERHVSYVRELRDLLEPKKDVPTLSFREGCDVIAGRNGVDWYTVNRAVIKVEGQPAELHGFLLLDKNCGRSRHEYGREWDRYFRSYYLVATAPAASVCADNACKSITKMDSRAARLAGLRVPTVTALLDRLRSELSDEAILLARCGADAVAARHYQERDYSSLTAGEALNGDGHRLNWFVKWPDGYVGRPVLFAFQCLYSNKMTGWRIDRTENADLVRLAAADALREALPRVIYIDNGRAGASKWLTGGVGLGRRFRFKLKVEDAIGVFRLLGIDLRFTNPYAGRSKKIERCWGDIESRLRARAELRLAYAGNGQNAAAENCSTHAVPLDLFVRVLGEEIAAYNAAGHDTPTAHGASCDELWNGSLASGAVLRRATESQRRLLLLAAQKVRVHAKDGCIHLFGNRYEVPDGVAAGGDVIVRFDPARLHDDLYIYDREGRALGSARCIAPVGFADHGAARETARLNSVRKRALRTELEAQNLIDRIELSGTLPQTEPPARTAAKVLRPFRSPIEAPRATEPEIFDSSMDIYDDEKAG